MSQNARVQVNQAYDAIADVLNEYVTHVSRHDAVVRTRAPLPVGTEVDVRFTILLDDFHVIDGLGQVAEVHDDGDASVMVVRFAGLSAGAQAILERIAP